MTIPKAFALVLSPSVLSFLRRNGKRFQYPLFAVIVASSPTNQSQMAVIVSSKVAAKATVRNQIRRRLLNSFYQNRSVMNHHYAILIYPKAAVATVPFEQVQQAMKRFLAALQ